MSEYVDEHESVRKYVNGVNVLMHSRNIACIDGHDSGTFFFAWYNVWLSQAVVDLKSKIENQNLIY